MTKFCKDCKHYVPSKVLTQEPPLSPKTGWYPSFPGHRHVSPTYITPHSCMAIKSLVTGEIRASDPETMRNIQSSCGPKAKLFEPIEVQKPLKLTDYEIRLHNLVANMEVTEVPYE
jgi:hypothetical protein